MRAKDPPPHALFQACRRLDVRPTRHLLVVGVASQQVRWFRRQPPPPHPPESSGIGSPFPPPAVPSPPSSRRWPQRTDYHLAATFPASTSRFGIGQVQDSHQTPLGLHRIARKVGAGWPVGTVFRARQPIGYTWGGLPQATIAHRILWLEGLEPGRNRGGRVDTFRRYIYIHGLAEEPTLGRPASHGCVHLAAAHLLPLFDRLPSGTLVWITAGR